MKTAITMEVKLPVKIEKKGRIYVSSCPVLDVFSQGETFDVAKKNIVEALTAFFIGCIELGTLNQVFIDCGFKPGYLPDKQEKQLAQKEDYVNIPIHLLTNKTRAKQCHV